MKRKLFILISLVFSLVLIFSGCNNTGDNSQTTEKEEVTAENTDEASTVYFTSNISPEGMVNIYQKLNWTPSGNVAVKLSTGEPPASNYLDPNLIKNLVQNVNGTIVECNTAYGGSRSETKSIIR